MTEFDSVGIAEKFQRDYHAYAGSDAISKYRRTTAGKGINFLLPAVYGPLLMEHVRAAMRDSGSQSASVLEFGCGAGMAVQYLAQQLLSEGIAVDRAVGTDLVPGMVAAASADLAEFASPDVQERSTFVATPNEELIDGISKALAVEAPTLAGAFTLALGVNTFRYAIRRQTASEVVEQLRYLLPAGGRIVMIDMNNRFPYGFKPGWRGFGRGSPVTFGTEELPTLDEYARPFDEGGFDIVAKTNFCWMPHSANGLRFSAMRAIGPVLDKVAHGHAMRSLVVARKR